MTFKIVCNNLMCIDCSLTFFRVFYPHTSVVFFSVGFRLVRWLKTNCFPLTNLNACSDYMNVCGSHDHLLNRIVYN